MNPALGTRGRRAAPAAASRALHRPPKAKAARQHPCRPRIRVTMTSRRLDLLDPAATEVTASGLKGEAPSLLRGVVCVRRSEAVAEVHLRRPPIAGGEKPMTSGARPAPEPRLKAPIVLTVPVAVTAMPATPRCSGPSLPPLRDGPSRVLGRRPVAPTSLLRPQPIVTDLLNDGNWRKTTRTTLSRSSETRTPGRTR